MRLPYDLKVICMVFVWIHMWFLR